MLISLIIRQFKTFKNQTFIPLIDNGNLTGIVGLNGIGKSSILESLDCFFNDKPWNLHISSKKSGSKENSAYIVPIFLIERDEVPAALQGIFEKINNAASDIAKLSKEINPSHKNLLDSYKNQFIQIERNFDLNDFFIVPIGTNFEKEVYTSFFTYEKLMDADGKSIDLSPVFDFIKNKYQYIYIPKDITPEQYSQLENNEIQKLMGLTLEGQLAEIVPSQQVSDINSKLNNVINQVSSKLEDYEYRTPHNKQQNLKKNDIYKLIIKAFFSIRILHKKFESTWLPINQLSTGEKAKSLLDLSEKLITHQEPALSKDLIIAIDEPEASLHISACFSQFEKIELMSKHCRQVLFCTHWYGFLSLVNDGTATVISRPPVSGKNHKNYDATADDAHKFDLIDLRYHREQIKQKSHSTNGTLPYDIKLKGINDLIQSIASSVSLESNPYSWLICEGSTERLYFQKYLIDHYKKNNIKIIPVGGANEIRKIYQHLSIILDDMKSNVKGKVVLLSDTDDQLVKYSVSDSTFLLCKRFVMDESNKKIILTNPESNPTSPSTCIEDILNVNTYLKVIDKHYKNEPLLADILSSKIDDKEVCFSLDLKKSEVQKIKQFFSEPGIKYEFAKHYIQACDPDSENIPSLFKEINNLFSKR
ncbi:AAA family ATPase [Comamonas sp.]|uniref:AAA family ATPase n=1 Tax=Comamonas sp. TaxID=34028 RepID=UPI00289775C4|nr:AAA family ATPase [Comamonas sp.]